MENKPKVIFNDDFRISILTYTTPHKKTYDTLMLLKSKGYNKVDVYSKKMSYKKTFKPMISHRASFAPNCNYEKELTLNKLCENFGYKLQELEDYSELSPRTNTIFLVCGAGILPQEFINSQIVINSHPGYIPQVRGLDSLKWAILNKSPIGVTSHIIGDEIDAGLVIERLLVPINKNDSFHEVAQRQYDMEIQLLVNAIKKINDTHIYYSGEDYPVTKRMNNEQEKMLIDRFEEYKLNIIKQ